MYVNFNLAQRVRVCSIDHVHTAVSFFQHVWILRQFRSTSGQAGEIVTSYQREMRSLEDGENVREEIGTGLDDVLRLWKKEMLFCSEGGSVYVLSL